MGIRKQFLKGKPVFKAEVKWLQEMVGENTIQYGFGLKYLD